MTVTMGITAQCTNCGCELTLDCGDYMPSGQLDLTLTCENDCGAPVLNAFVKLADFQPVS
jgi:hypothetical protein